MGGNHKLSFVRSVMFVKALFIEARGRPWIVVIVKVQSMRRSKWECVNDGELSQSVKLVPCAK